MTIEKKEIVSREEVSLLVRSFYSKIRIHAELGPIFNGIVEDWEHHLERLTDFWDWFVLGTTCLVQEAIMVWEEVEVPRVTLRGTVVCEILIG